ncbi:MAG: SMC-Scp complex subunit ScpB [Clostridia bacterium]|nr:SMC-Scp complex subunit ScpB [Clostridia bacterium]
MKNLKEIIKATLFVAGEGIDLGFIADKLDVPIKDVRKAIIELKADIGEDDGIQIIEYKNKFQLTSNPAYADYISSVLNPIREKALTKASLETLAIIAYKQPITRLEIEDIRKVGCDYAINMLEENKMIEVVGRKDAVGKPLLYGTTDEFLKRFGLQDISHLPDYEELMERIAVIRQDEKPKGDGLYFDYKLENSEQPEEEETEMKIINFQEVPESEMDAALEELTYQILSETRGVGNEEKK